MYGVNFFISSLSIALLFISKRLLKLSATLSNLLTAGSLIGFDSKNSISFKESSLFGKGLFLYLLISNPENSRSSLFGVFIF